MQKQDANPKTFEKIAGVSNMYNSLLKRKKFHSCQIILKNVIFPMYVKVELLNEIVRISNDKIGFN